MERLLAPHGPYGRVLRPVRRQGSPSRIAYVQCAGSRDQTLGVPYCSRVCCMYAIKQAMLLCGSLPIADITIYYMDIRAFGKGYEQFYRSAKAMGIEFVKGKVARLTEDDDQGVIVRVERIDAARSGRRAQARPGGALAGHAARPRTRSSSRTETGEDGFVAVPRPKIAPCRTALDGIFVAGTATGPMDIVDTIVEPGAAAAESGRIPASARSGRAAPVIDHERSLRPCLRHPNSLDATLKSQPIARALHPSEPRIGVYVCHCGGNISDAVQCRAGGEALGKLPNVVVSRDYQFMCSDPGQKLITEDIHEKGVNRVVIGACSLFLHEQTFRNAVERAGLNPYLYYHVGLREQDSWVHHAHPDEATEKAIRMMSAGVAKARLLRPLDPCAWTPNKQRWSSAAGVAGLRSALSIARRGLQVTLVEKSPFLGGRMAQWDHVFPTDEDARDLLHDLIEEVLAEPNITIHTGAEVVSAQGLRRQLRACASASSRAAWPRISRRVDEAIAACPVEVPDEFNFGLTKRKAIYQPYAGLLSGQPGHRLGALHPM